jgi:predicted acyltransferase
MANSNRFVSLDDFRGFTIASMILVNTPGSWSYVLKPLGHANWHGLLFADLVFPFFLLISGIGMAFSLGRSKREIRLDSYSLKKLGKRVGILFLIGLTLNWLPFFRSFESLRILGVLQRIALAYGLAAIIIYLCKGAFKPLLLTSVGLLLGYWALLFFGGDASSPFSLEGNLGLKVDLWLLGPNHLYKGEGIPFDPEGIVGTISSAVQIIVGYLIGMKLLKVESWKEKAIFLAKYGLALLFVGYIFHQVFPINKKIWTSSFVLVTSGYALIVFAGMVLMGQNKWTNKFIYPFRVIGLNPLFCFVLSILIVKLYFVINIPIANGETLNLYAWLFRIVYAPVFGNMLGSLLFALSHVLAVWLIAYPLYKKNIIIKL